MFKKYFTFFLFFFLSTYQINAQSHKNLLEINKVWSVFYEAFSKLDDTLMAKIHSKNLVRISGGKNILDYDSYINNYKKGFEASKNTNQTSDISLRFFERINNNSKASERGIYKLIRNKGKKNEKAYYGQFHVIFVKENNKWKILMDYDSNEGNTIGEEEFLKAHTIDNFEEF